MAAILEIDGFIERSEQSYSICLTNFTFYLLKYITKSPK